MNPSATSQSAGGRKQFTGIDLVKFLMALAVVAIHVQAIYVALPLRITDFPAQSFSRGFEWFIALAVPFFFMSTGYLLASRRPDAPAVVARCIKLARLYGSWLLIYLPLSITYYVVGKYPPPAALHNYLTFVAIQGESPMAWPLWFIFSMAIVLAIFSLLHRFMRWEYAAWALFLFAMAVRLFPYAGHSVFSLGDNATAFWDYYAFLTSRTLGGGVYIAGGMLLQMYQGRLTSVFVVILALVASFAVFSLIPGFFMAPFFGGMAMLIIALLIGKFISERPVFLRLRSYSMWIYYVHMIPLALVYLLWPSAFRGLGIWAALAVFSLVSVAMAASLTRLQARSAFAWLRFLVS